MQSQACFVTKSVRFGCTELFFFRNPLREIWRLGMVSGPVLLGNKSDFHTLWDRTTGNNGKVFDEFGQMLVLGARNDTKKIRKAGADIFANVGLEKLKK